MIVGFFAAIIGVWFLYRYLREKRKLLPFVSILGFCWVAQYLGVFIDFWSLVVTGANIGATFAIQISYFITPISIMNAIWLGFSIFNPKWKKQAFYIYLATAVPWYIALFGWPELMYVSNANVSVLNASGLLLTTNLSSVLLYLAIVYIFSAIFVIAGGFFSLRKKVTGFERQRATDLGVGHVLFGIAAILETTTGSFGDPVLIIARIMMAIYLVLIYLGFSAKSAAKGNHPPVGLATEEINN